MIKSKPLGITGNALGQNLRELPAQAGALGFSALLLDSCIGSVDLTELSRSGQREVTNLLARQRISLTGIQVAMGPTGLSAKGDIDRELKQLTKVFQAAAGLACSLVCVDLGELAEPKPENKPRPKITPQQAGLIIVPSFAPEPVEVFEPDTAMMDLVDQVLRELGRQADRTGTTVALRSDLSSFAALERALLAAACPWFGIDLDPVAMLRDRMGMDEIFSRLGQLVRHVRLRDAQRGSDRRTRPAATGRGEVPWRDLLGCLEAAGYGGSLTLDPADLPDRLGAAVAGKAWVNSLWD